MKTSHESKAGPVARALVIIMHDKGCEAGVASGRLRTEAAQRGLTVDAVATDIVAAGPVTRLRRSAP